jgi:hypothetical protein
MSSASHAASPRCGWCRSCWHSRQPTTRIREGQPTLFRASLAALRDGIASFVRAEVVPPERNDDVLTGPQRLYAKDGHYVPEVVALMREVRLASAKERPENLCSADTRL